MPKSVFEKEDGMEQNVQQLLMNMGGDYTMVKMSKGGQSNGCTVL